MPRDVLCVRMYIAINNMIQRTGSLKLQVVLVHCTLVLYASDISNT